MLWILLCLIDIKNIKINDFNIPKVLAVKVLDYL